MGYANTFLFVRLFISLSVSVSDLLGLKPAPNNGTYGSLNDMLKNPPFEPSMPEEVTLPSPADPDTVVTHDLGCSCDDEVTKIIPDFQLYVKL